MMNDKNREFEIQGELHDLMTELYYIDFSNVDMVIDWLKRFQAPSDNDYGVIAPWEEVLDVFKKHGYTPHMNCYNGSNAGEFNMDDEKDFSGWMIGQALGDLERFGHILIIFPAFVELLWLKNFRKKEATIKAGLNLSEQGHPYMRMTLDFLHTMLLLKTH